MNLTRDRVRSIGWAFVLTVCLILTAALTLRVNAVRGQVHEAEDRIISLKREIVFLETEFKTRANQQQLKILNQVEFGYAAPSAEQYIEGERQLAALGKARGPGAPKPIRVAHAPGEMPAQFVSPVSGKPETVADKPEAKATPQKSTGTESADPVAEAIAAASLSERLARIDMPAAEGQ